MHHPECEEITNEWLHEHRKQVLWKRPIYRYAKDSIYCWQIGIVHGINMAGRTELKSIYVVSRWGKSDTVSKPNSLRITSTKLFNDMKSANGHCHLRFQAKMREGVWKTYSPLLNLFLEQQKGLFVNQQLEENIIVQPVDDSDETVYIWLEANSDYMNVFSEQYQSFIDFDNRIEIFLHNILDERPNIFLIGKFNRSMNLILIYDFIMYEESESVESSLLKRLNLLRNYVSSAHRDHIGYCVNIAPFQMTNSLSEAREHENIYIQGRFNRCLLRNA